MPVYEYYCSANNLKVEVTHSMKEKLQTWGELYRRAGIDKGSTPDDAPVSRLISGGIAIPYKTSAAEPGTANKCAGCSAGSCGHCG